MSEYVLQCVYGIYLAHGGVQFNRILYALPSS